LSFHDILDESGALPLVDRLRTSVPAGVDYHPYLAREDGRLPMSDFGSGHRFNVTGLYHDMWGFPSTDPTVVNDLAHHLVDKIEHRSAEITRYKAYRLDDAETFIISYGLPTRSAMQVMKDSRWYGSRLGILELETLWPFPAKLVRDVCEKARAVVVVEMNMGQIHQQVRNAVRDPERVFLANRVDGQFITPQDIRKVMRILEGFGV